MDKSKTYIEMCAKAKEIQNHWKEFKDDIGSFYVVPYFHDEFRLELESMSLAEEFNPKVECTCYDYCSCPSCEALTAKGVPEWVEGDIWLPRQDQLQNIAINNYDGSDNIQRIQQLNADFTNFLIRAPKNELFETHEQLWLAFTMKMVYQKSWENNWK